MGKVGQQRWEIGFLAVDMSGRRLLGHSSEDATWADTSRRLTFVRVLGGNRHLGFVSKWSVLHTMGSASMDMHRVMEEFHGDREVEKRLRQQLYT